ncbi:MAG: hypothetical protein N3A68_00630 [Bacteroidia bacterium]|nr:hypothetical protein [Bacteroidia bacterium]
MKKAKLWAYSVFLCAALSGIAFLLPQFRIVLWDTGQEGWLFFWGGHACVGATVPAVVYGIAAVWGLLGVGALFWAGRQVLRLERKAIAWLNWAAFFLVMELIFLLGAAEEVLTDLRVQNLHADSFAQVGSWLTFIVLFVLLFLPGRVKKALFKQG